ncbi:MAG: hypothetical protein IKL68_01385 [Clostridia bacterium]|nr:hypothetical protein [Clostridia bacterium]
MKKGIINICFMFFGMVMIFVLTFTYILYFQVGNITNNIKQELYYTLMNGKLELNKEELSYSNFNIDKIKLENRLQKWSEDVKKTLINVDKVEIEELLTNIVLDKAILKVKIKVTFRPLVKIRDELSFYIQEEIDLRLLKYN